MTVQRFAGLPQPLSAVVHGLFPKLYAPALKFAKRAVLSVKNMTTNIAKAVLKLVGVLPKNIVKLSVLQEPPNSRV